jgi:glycosyltransferase involved in cell wall biosynthesis
VVHSHNYIFSGYILRIASQVGVPLRIAHIYPTVDLRPQTLRRKAYRFLMTRWINRYGNCFIADSRAALDSFWGGERSDGKPYHVLYCGIDLKPFTREGSQEQFRRELNLPLGQPVVVNVGRFVPHKNQVALVEIAGGVLQHFPDALFVLAGDGPLWPEVRSRVSEKGLDNSFRFLRRVPDLVPLWKAADVFVFPTLMEGFGIVVVEAAASGLPVVASDIPGVREAARACSEVTLLNPQDLDGFADAIVRYLKAGRACPPDPQRLAPFSIETSVAALAQIYSESLSGLGRAMAETYEVGATSPAQEREDGGKLGT